MIHTSMGSSLSVYDKLDEYEKLLRLFQPYDAEENNKDLELIESLRCSSSPQHEKSEFFMLRFQKNYSYLKRYEHYLLTEENIQKLVTFQINRLEEISQLHEKYLKLTGKCVLDDYDELCMNQIYDCHGRTLFGVACDSGQNLVNLYDAKSQYFRRYVCTIIDRINEMMENYVKQNEKYVQLFVHAPVVFHLGKHLDSCIFPQRRDIVQKQCVQCTVISHKASSEGTKILPSITLSS